VTDIPTATQTCIRTFGEFAGLPPTGIAPRLGKEGTQIHRSVRGEGPGQLRPVEDPLRFEQELESPVELSESLAFWLSRMLHHLCGKLSASSLSTDEIHLTLTLENAPVHACTLRLPVPMRDAMTFLKLLQLELNERLPMTPVLKIRLELRPAQPRTEQHNLFLALSPEAQQLEVKLSKLIHLLGAENVGLPELLNTHRPDAFRINQFAGTGIASDNSLPTAPTLVLRRYRPPKLAQVRKKNERPDQVYSLHLRGNVIACAGPWPNSGDWWKVDVWSRDEWDVALSDGRCVSTSLRHSNELFGDFFF
jgi:protein ImuB